jgi:hypothetical protein
MRTLCAGCHGIPLIRHGRVDVASARLKTEATATAHAVNYWGEQHLFLDRVRDGLGH